MKHAAICLAAFLAVVAGTASASAGMVAAMVSSTAAIKPSYHGSGTFKVPW